jgi:hypothetical protein
MKDFEYSLTFWLFIYIFFWFPFPIYFLLLQQGHKLAFSREIEIERENNILLHKKCEIINSCSRKYFDIPLTIFVQVCFLI